MEHESAAVVNTTSNPAHIEAPCQTADAMDFDSDSEVHCITVGY